MRHKYETRGIVLSRSPLGEMSALVTVLTPELGLVRARAQSVRRSGAKLAPALVTFAESSLVLVRGREGWRVAGAVLEENWYKRFSCPESHRRAGRISSLLLRLVVGEAPDPSLFPIVRGLFEVLTELPRDVHEVAEVLTALRMLAALGLDVGDVPGETPAFTESFLVAAAAHRTEYIARINHGIVASGL